MLKPTVVRRSVTGILLSLILLCGLGASVARAQVVSQSAFYAADGWEFGSALASSGNTMVVGDSAWNNNPYHNPVGAAYVYAVKNGQWTQQAELTASDGKAYDQFGGAVALCGSMVAVGAARHHGTGAVYVFTQNKGVWSQQELLPGDGQTGDHFGCAVAMSPTTLAVGACQKGSWQAGEVYTYTLKSGKWVLQAEWSATNPTTGNSTFFGSSLALSASGTTLVVGAPGANYGFGMVCVYTLSGSKWKSQAMLTASDEQDAGEFGYSVALSGTTLAVGAPADSLAYVFNSGSSGWSQQAEFSPSEGPSVTGFGSSVALSGNMLAVSAVNLDDIGTYVYTQSAGVWAPWAELFPGDLIPQTDTQFGVSVAIVGNLIAVARPTAWAVAVSPDAPLGEVCCFAVGGVEGTASDGQYDDAFGYSTALAGTTVLAGAPGRVAGTGAVYAYTRNSGGLTAQTLITAANGQIGDGFGTALAFDGTTLVVGAPYASNGAGAVYLYTYKSGAWKPQTELTASDGQNGDLFGNVVALSGSSIVIGAPGRNNGTGAAYVFTLNGASWSQQAELIAGDGESGDGFGSSVGLSGSNLVVGAPYANTATVVNPGLAYLYTLSAGQWTQVTELTSTNGAFGDQFGFAVAISGGLIAVGAPNTNGGAGAIYPYTQTANGWKPQSELTGLGSDALFGGALALSGNTLVVGAYGRDFFTGQVYALTLNNGVWSLSTALTAQDGQQLGYFGTSVALSNGSIAIGAPSANSGTGSLYAY
jgi:drug/metabolite transporter superfamily protein YnfA